MPRYPLILRDATYVALLMEAGRQGKTLGKFLNEILDNYAAGLGEAGQLPLNPVCIICGRPAVFVGFGEGQQRLFVCSHHRKRLVGLKGTRHV